MEINIPPNEHSSRESLALIGVILILAIVLFAILTMAHRGQGDSLIDTGPLGSRGNPLDISILNPIRPSLD